MLSSPEVRLMYLFADILYSYYKNRYNHIYKFYYFIGMEAKNVTFPAFVENSTIQPNIQIFCINREFK